MMVSDMVLKDLLGFLDIFFTIQTYQASTLHHFLPREFFISHASEGIYDDTEDDVDDDSVDQDVETEIEEDFEHEFVVVTVVGIHHISDGVPQTDAQRIHETARECSTDVNTNVISSLLRVKVGLQCRVGVYKEDSNHECLCQSAKPRCRSLQNVHRCRGNVENEHEM